MGWEGVEVGAGEENRAAPVSLMEEPVIARPGCDHVSVALILRPDLIEGQVKNRSLRTFPLKPKKDADGPRMAGIELIITNL